MVVLGTCDAEPGERAVRNTEARLRELRGVRNEESVNDDWNQRGGCRFQQGLQSRSQRRWLGGDEEVQGTSGEECQAQGTASAKVCRCHHAWELEHWEEGLCWGLEDRGHYKNVNLAVRREAQEGLEQRNGACFHRIPLAAVSEGKGGCGG